MHEKELFRVSGNKIYSSVSTTYLNPDEIAIIVNKKEKTLVKIGNFKWLLQLYETFKQRCYERGLTESAYDIVLVSFSPRYDYLSLDEKCTLCNLLKISPDVMKVLVLSKKDTRKLIAKLHKINV